MTITLASIYRYPIKGFTGQKLEKAAITKGKPLAWDRAFAIENGDSGFDPAAPAHLPKIHFLMLMKQPELATLITQFDDVTGAFSVQQHGTLLAEGNLFEPDSMQAALQVMAGHCKKPMRGSPRLLHASEFAFTDSRTQDLSLINLASVSDLEAKIGNDIDPMRFRGNLYIEGAAPWQEHDWVDKIIEVGAVSFQVRKRTVRCAATNANPTTGERDQNIPKALMDHYGHTDCGIHLMPLGDGTLTIGDRITLPQNT